jgi:NAD(P)-dependent dehydrogenase (short-subunit alcohol dehydrogenase family)
VDELRGRVAVVTGAGRGIGAAVARLLVAQGARVVVNDLGVSLSGGAESGGATDELAKQLIADGGEAVASRHDVGDHAAAGELIRLAIDSFGRLDILVNNAGILRDRPVYDMSFEDWEAVIRVHLHGTFNTTKHAAAHWREANDPDGHFRLINVVSRSGLHGAPRQPNYAAAKMGVLGLTYSCANALACYGVTANAIAPSADTRMTDSMPQERRIKRDGMGSRTPENVAPVAAYLASPRSDWCTGQIVSARGNLVGLYTAAAETRVVTSTGPWQLDALYDTIEATFRPALLNQPLFQKSQP